MHVYARDRRRFGSCVSDVAILTHTLVCITCVVRCTDVLRGATALVQVTQDWRALQYGSAELKADKEFMLAAVCGCA